jgi:hypothetical protein
VSFQKTIQFVAAEPKEFGGLVVGQPMAAACLGDQSFEGRTRKVAAGGQQAGNLVGEVKSNLHGAAFPSIIRERRQNRKRPGIAHGCRAVCLLELKKNYFFGQEVPM